VTELSALPAGSTIGILGGGQLGRMLALAAAKLGLKSHIYCPDPHSPAFDVTPFKTVAAYDDAAALNAFAEQVDVITYEFENVPAETAEILAGLKQRRWRFRRIVWRKRAFWPPRTFRLRLIVRFIHSMN
jgi:5-(carboxyamino)imidazole ribonucleotide synthase